MNVSKKPMKGRAAIAIAMLLLLGSGCASKPPTSAEEIKNANVALEGPVNEEPSMDIFTPTDKKREGVPPLPGILEKRDLENKGARIRTARGEIVFKLLGDEAPLAASNFVWLARHRFYDGLTFHRVEPGFVIQGGDPKGDGTGGPGYTFPDEPVRRPYLAGTVAMANAGSDTNGSQFFIMLEDNPNLPPNYTIFGLVTEGLDVVRSTSRGDALESVSIE